jgi:dual specificity MAP kinase phosphatase
MEMCTMSKASEISQNVWLGSSADVPGENIGEKWDVIIEACDLAQMPSPETLTYILETIDHQHQDPLYLEFPGSGTISPLSWSSTDVDGMVETCRCLHAIANGESIDEEELDEDGDRRMSLGQAGRPRKVLVHCADGYTETSLLALAYIIYAEAIPVHVAWMKLHTVKNRNFFAYDKDLAFLRYVEHKLLGAAARDRKLVLDNLELDPPGWLYRMDGSLPSRILPYMYLGNLLHANNCGLLQAVGIKRVLSIGEDLSWTEEEKSVFGKHRVMMVKDLQDNGCDPLEYQFRSCLEFIGMEPESYRIGETNGPSDEGHRLDEPILVHCRVGVSRSATICIAEVMRSLNLSLPRA